jgi:undecaprenyl-diphosphatase
VNDYLLSVVLGIVEGLTEFLPVSSTAHLRVTEALLGIDLSSGYWKMYTIVIQLGAILCLPIYFRTRIAKFLRTFPKGENGDKNLITHPVTLVIIGSAVTAIPSLLLLKIIGKNLENLFVIGWSLIVGGIVMWAVDAHFGTTQSRELVAAGDVPRSIRTESMEQMSLGQAVWIGACQILSAVFPGTSRSMATIAGGQIVGLTRSAALEFSFFLSMPIMAAATGLELTRTLLGKHDDAMSPVAMSSHQWILLAIGFVVSFIVAYAVVAWFMRWVRSRGFVPFAVYRILAGAAVLFWAMRS